MLNPTTTTTHLIRLESCKPFCQILLTLFQPFQIFMNFLSSGKRVELRICNRHATEDYSIQSECVKIERKCEVPQGMQMGDFISLNYKEVTTLTPTLTLTHSFQFSWLKTRCPPSSHRSRLEKKPATLPPTAGAHLPCSPEAPPAPSSTYVWTYMAEG